MSSDHQRYSITNQSQALAKYAVERNLVIVEAYADEGRSGLNFRGRPALQSLIADVQLAVRPFDVLLVLDISRWGRFQNVDESAYYEFICWSSGVDVVYCAEPFENDGSPVSSMIKGMKRVMAGEYSRELSRRVVASKLHQAALGFHQGGKAPYGLRRVCVDDAGKTKAMLRKGERKSFAADHISLASGPPDEVSVVQRVFRYFVQDERGVTWIARRLNQQGIPGPTGKAWGEGTIRYMLENESYIGNVIYNRYSNAMKMPRSAHAAVDHVRCDGAFPGIISQRTFAAAAARLLLLAETKSNADMLDQLRSLHKKAGQISRALIDNEPGMPNASLYYHRFGTLLEAYGLAGIPPKRPSRYLDDRDAIAGVRMTVLGQLAAGLTEAGHGARKIPGRALIEVDDTWTVAVKLVTQSTLKSGATRWEFKVKKRADLYLIVRLGPDLQIHDFHLFPAAGLASGLVYLYESNGAATDAHQFGRIEDMLPLARRLLVGEIPQPVGKFGSHCAKGPVPHPN
jgi:DNA invertase Pin-like site-specific DNA recombinase